MTWTDKQDWKTNKVTQADAECGQFRLCIHHYVGHGNTWFFSVVHGPFNKHKLTSTKLAEAKLESMKLFHGCLKEALAARNAITKARRRPGLVC